MARSPLSVHQYRFQTAAVAVASPASAFFQSGDLPNTASLNFRPVGALNLIAPRSPFHIGLKFMQKITPPI
jgi:hypothetical protein